MSKVVRFFALLPALALAACTDEISRLGQIGAPAPFIEQKTDGYDTEIILHPVAVWEERDAADSRQVSVDGHAAQVRPRSGGFWDKSFVRTGLFWHSRQDNIFVPVVVLGPTAKINQVEMRAGNRTALLRRADNFKFTPGGEKSKKGGQSSAAFEMKPEMLAAIVSGDTAHMIIHTSRGNLHLGLDVVKNDSPSAVRENARYLFARFAEKVAQVKRGG